MKIKCMHKCTGVGYENFNVDETRDITSEIAQKLIDFQYAVEVVEPRKKKVVKTENDD